MRDRKFVLLVQRDEHGRPRQLLRGTLRREPEELEPRCLLAAAPIEFGAVYTERDLGSDAHADTIEISFEGGAPGTELTRIEIDGDKFDPGLSLADVIFDVSLGGLGADLAFPADVQQQGPAVTKQIVVEDGATRVVLLLEGFTAGQTLVLSIDADEVQGYDPAETDLALINDELDAITSGAEFQGSSLSAYFVAPHFYDVEASAEFRNRYDNLLDTTSLGLPRDDEGSNRDRTAGAVGTVLQQPLPVAISGHVFEDRNANLHRDPGDLGIAGVELSLYVLQGDTYAPTPWTTTTNSLGEYAFPLSLELAPGTYQIRELQPAGYFSVGAIVGTVAGSPVGDTAGDDVLTTIAIPVGGDVGHDYDFAEARPATLRGRVHLSSPDGDCFSDSVVHPPLSGVRVFLHDAAGTVVQETTTDQLGRYHFANLRPGEYSVMEITPEPWFDGGARVGHVDNQARGILGTDQVTQIPLFSGDDAVDYDFCEFPPAALSGLVYHDRDLDGTPGPNEEGIGQAILSLLDEQGTLIQTTESDSRGRYEFVGLRAGNYRVVELQPVGWLDGVDRAGTVQGLIVGEAVNPGDQINDITLRWGDDAVDYDFGEIQPASLRGKVHLSTPDGDCWHVADEILEPVVGAVVQLLDATGQVMAETVTGADGTYAFPEIAPGTYAIREVTPSGLLDGGSRAGTVDAIPVGIVAGDNDIREIVLRSNQSAKDYDFCEHRPSILSGYVYSDIDNDGQRDAGEAPIPQATIQLFDGSGTLVAETKTDASGRYAFAGLLPGTYSLRQLQPEGWLDGIDSAGTVGGERRGRALEPGDAIVDVQLGWGEEGVEFNFGELLPASLEGVVRSSVAEDCWTDPHALPLSQVRIWLVDSAGKLVAETRTDLAGHYRFSELPPGEYSIFQEQPGTVFDGAQRAGSLGGDILAKNQIRQIPVTTAAEGVDFDFCEVPASSISGFVFVDGEPIPLPPGESLPVDIAPLRSGDFTLDDLPIAGVKLELRHGIRGEPVDSSEALPGAYPSGAITTTTDANGYYEFPSLPKGNYAIYELHPEGYIDGVDTPGTTSGIAINPVADEEGVIFLETVSSTLAEPPRNDAIVRIGLPAGTNSRQNNFSEVQTRTDVIRFPQGPPPARPLPPFTSTPSLPSTPPIFRPLEPAPLQDVIYPIDGSYTVKGSTWHLSIIDGGQPRISQADAPGPSFFPASAWQQRALRQGHWKIPSATGTSRSFYFGIAGGIPISGDFNGDGAAEIGQFVDGHWFIDLNGNGRWDSGDLWAKLGHAEDMPVTGDWDGDGKDDIGIFGRAWPGDPKAVRYEPGLPDMDNVPSGERKNMPPDDEEATLGRRVMQLTDKGSLRTDLIDHVFLYGTAGDHAVVGDWNGDGIDTIGVFRHGSWNLDTDGNGRITEQDDHVEFGLAGDVPLVGDFNGDGIDDLAVVRDGKIIVDSNGNRQLDADDLVIHVGTGNGRPVVDKWTGEATDQVAWFQDREEEEIVVARQVDPE